MQFHSFYKGAETSEIKLFHEHICIESLSSSSYSFFVGGGGGGGGANI